MWFTKNNYFELFLSKLEKWITQLNSVESGVFDPKKCPSEVEGNKVQKNIENIGIEQFT